METSLHRQLKVLYAANEAQVEVCLDGFRIDAIAQCGELIEIQHASLGALRDKTLKLLSQSKHSLRIVKPIIQRKRVITLTERGGQIKRSRMSPKRGEWLDIFLDLVHFTSVFPRKRLTLEVVMIEAEESRVDRVRASRRGKKYFPVDQHLVAVGQSIVLRTKRDLLDQLPMHALPSIFGTAELAAAMQRPKWFAQKVAYCLREIGAVKLAGKRGNNLLYQTLPARHARLKKPTAA
ncbi:MAG: hypothetical protein KDB22_00815 [Planctomycetales bacterium]|nr:hypothetical protein [Planctomycetales bacterium]